MSPEEHYARGELLLSNSENARVASQELQAQTDAMVAGAHFQAAAAGAGMRALKLGMELARGTEGNEAAPGGTDA